MFRSVLHPGLLPIGIDIGSSSVKLAQLRRVRGGFEVVGSARVECPTTDETVSAADAIDAIDRGIASAGLIGRHAVISIDDRLIRVRSARTPRLTDDELDRSLSLDAPERLGMTEADDPVFGWLDAGEVRQGEETWREAILVGARGDVIEDLVMGLAARGVRPLAVEPGFAAIARCYTRRLRRNADRGTSLAIVDVGERATGIILTLGTSVCFYKLLELGDRDITRASCSRLSLDEASVVELRRRRLVQAQQGGNGTGDEKVQRALFEASRPVMRDIAQEINLCLRHFGVSFRGARPSKIVLSGGLAQEPGFVEAIEEATRLTTAVGVPLEGTSVEDLRKVGPQLATAIGLSLRSEENAARTKARSWTPRGKTGEAA
ncbi:MAG: pilus assembly protein PilM [Planctomycetota bacterium]